MWYRVAYGRKAQNHISDLFGYVAEQHGPEQADAIIEKLLAFTDGLGSFPARGHPRDDLRPGLRVLGYQGRATVAFRVDGPVVTILGIYWGPRDWEPLITADHDDQSG